MTDADDDVVDALDWLEIDSPELRWLAVRDYLDELRREASRAINAIWLIATFLDYCEINAFKRGEVPRCTTEPEFGCTCRIDEPRCFRFWSPKLIAADYLTARLQVLKPYSGKARERAVEILDPYMLPMLRKGAK